MGSHLEKDMADEEAEALVVDNGSGTVKAGIAGEDAPKVMFSTVVGYAKHKSTVVGMGEKECYVGDQAIQKRGTLLLKVCAMTSIRRSYALAVEERSSPNL